ncbi:phosphoglycerate kinase [Mucilaginibacter lappiensis]|nr:phosphoglycerate kinase [Mucilaginibacter lappiensis]
MTNTPLVILIAGPYRSGTNDDPALMAQNLKKLEEMALPIFRAGHIPVIGEWFALPLLEQAGSTRPGDAAYEEILYPVAQRLLTKCDAVLRIPGASKGADEDVRIAKERGLKVYYQLEDIIAQ